MASSSAAPATGGAEGMDFKQIQDAVRELPEEIDFPAVIELLTSQHTSHVVDRHIKAVLLSIIIST